MNGFWQFSQKIGTAKSQIFSNWKIRSEILVRACNSGNSAEVKLLVRKHKLQIHVGAR